MKKAVAALISVLCVPAAVYAEGGASSVGTEGSLAPSPTPVVLASADPQVVGVTGSATAPGAPAPAPTALTATSGGAVKAEKPWSLSLNLDQSVGHGTFIRVGDLGAIESSLGVSGSYKFDVKSVKLSATGSLGFSYEYTRPDNENGRRWNYTDPRFGLSAPKLYTEKVTGIGFSPSMGVTLPLSYTSRTSSTITALSLSAKFDRSFGEKVKVGWTLRGGRNFHAHPEIRFGPDTETYDDGFARTLCRTGVEVCDTGGVNTKYSLSNTLNASYEPLEKLSLGISYGLSHSWKYTVVAERDEYTPKVLDSEGNQVAEVGLTRSSDMVSGTLSADYSLNDRYSLSFALGSRSRAKQSDNSGFRFPWFDFSGAASNSVTYSLGFAASF